MLSQKRILVCPLNWGLGHASRCIPVIRLLLQKNAKVIIAAEGRALELLKKEFPDLEFIVFNGYNIQYPDKGSMVLKMFFSLPRIFFGIYREHRTIKKIIAEKNINVIISDNRFGCWNKNIKSIFITHQLMIKTPFAEKLLHRINSYFIKKYDECWVPDDPGAGNLSGDLSHKYPLPENTFFVGTLSRFNSVIARDTVTKPSTEMTDCFVLPETGRTNNDGYNILTIISGPEPQRSIFEKLILEQLQKNNVKALVVCGKTESEQKTEKQGSIVIVNHLNAAEMRQAILNSEIIIARSGYSTIMDLAAMGKKAIFIPTPGQTEQEYLGEYFMQQNIAYCMRQEIFNLATALRNSEKYKGFEKRGMGNELEERINTLLPY